MAPRGLAAFAAADTSGVDSARRLRLGDALCLGLIGLNVVASAVAFVATAYLLAHPLVGAAVSGSTGALVSAGAYAHDGRLPLWEVAPIALTTLVVANTLYWWAGHRYGDAGSRFVVRHRLFPAVAVERTEALVARYGFWLVVVSYALPLPGALIYLLVGASGLRLWKFVVGNAVSVAAWVAGLLGLGWTVGDAGLDVVHAVGDWAVLATGALALLAVVGAFARYPGLRSWAADLTRCGAAAVAGLSARLRACTARAS